MLADRRIEGQGAHAGGRAPIATAGRIDRAIEGSIRPTHSSATDPLRRADRPPTTAFDTPSNPADRVPAVSSRRRGPPCRPVASSSPPPAPRPPLRSSRPRRSAGGGARRSPAAGGSRRAPCRASRRREGSRCGRACTTWAGASAPSSRSREREFRRVVARRRVATSSARGHALKARVTGLRPHEDYYYRFSTRTTDGPVGRFRTALPADSRQPVRFAFWSCQDFTHGLYNAHAAMADDDLDFVICLGDYLYAETEERGATAVRADRIGSTGPTGTREAITRRPPREVPPLPLGREPPPPPRALADRHGLGRPRGRGQLRGRRARRRPPAREALQRRPQARGLQGVLRVDVLLAAARRPHLPVRALRADGRPHRHGPAPVRADQPCNDAIAPPCPELNQRRAFLGQPQMQWVQTRLRGSQAAWKLTANEVMMMPVKLPNGAFARFDSCQGYPAEREQLLGFIKSNGIKDVVFVTGDIHTFVAGDVRTNLGVGDTVAIEFVGGSITSRGIGEGEAGASAGNDANPATDPNLINALRGLNPWTDQADLDHHGYARVTATQQSLECELVRMATIKRRTSARLTTNGFRFTVARGQQSIKGVNGPPA